MLIDIVKILKSEVVDILLLDICHFTPSPILLLDICS